MVSNSKKTFALLAIIFILLTSCGEDGGQAPLTGVPCTTCKIFVDVTPTEGDLGGVAGADDKCAASPQNPEDGTYKALIGLDNVRDGAAGAQVDWVIKPNTVYTRVDGTVIATSDANGVLPVNLVIPIEAAVGYWVWTGLSTLNAALPFADSCNGWTNATGGFSGIVGASQANNSAWINSVSTNCNSFRAIYCVEQ